MPEGQVLEFSGITKRFGSVVAVSDFTARVQPGVVTGFLGPNGAGKTTTLRALLGLVRTEGTATIGGKRYSQLRDPLREVGAVLDSSRFNPGRSGVNHLKVYADAAGISRTRIDETLGLVGLSDFAGRKVGGYSLGMKQRLGLAFAMLGDPGVLVLDEPINGLDPEGIRWMRGLLRELAAEGRTVLVSSHLLAEVQQSVDDCLIIARGRLVYLGRLDEIVDANERSTVVDSPDRAALSAALTEAQLTHETLRSGIRVPAADPALVGQVAAGAGVALSLLSQRGPSLEEAFLGLTSGEREGSLGAGDAGAVDAGTVSAAVAPPNASAGPGSGSGAVAGAGAALGGLAALVQQAPTAAEPARTPPDNELLRPSAPIDHLAAETVPLSVVEPASTAANPDEASADDNAEGLAAETSHPETGAPETSADEATPETNITETNTAEPDAAITSPTPRPPGFSGFGLDTPTSPAAAEAALPALTPAPELREAAETFGNADAEAADADGADLDEGPDAFDELLGWAKGSEEPSDEHSSAAEGTDDAFAALGFDLAGSTESSGTSDETLTTAAEPSDDHDVAHDTDSASAPVTIATPSAPVSEPERNDEPQPAPPATLTEPDAPEPATQASAESAEPAEPDAAEPEHQETPASDPPVPPDPAESAERQHQPESEWARLLFAPPHPQAPDSDDQRSDEGSSR